MKRIATVTGLKENIEAYLPFNYTLVMQEDGRFLIEGEDVAGWTLDGYVIPRLASGLITATELSAPHLES